MTKHQRRLGMLLCLFTIVLAILDQNIVSSAIVPIVRDLDPAHGVEHVAWLVAAFALAATVVLPLYGRLSDAFGGKPVWLSAVGIFLVGSVLCGAAQSMAELIAFRAIQGAGAGGLMSVTMVVIANLAQAETEAETDARTDAEAGAEAGAEAKAETEADARTEAEAEAGPGTRASRGRGGNLGGLFAGVGMAIGPFIGGLFADHDNWRGIFYINVPLGLIVIAGGLFFIRIPRVTRRADLDLPGAALAAAFAASLLLVCEWGGQRYAWSSPAILGLIAAGVVSLALFAWRESVAAHPVLPPALLRDRTIRNSYIVQLLIGAAMIGAMVHLMLYLQVARGVSASDSGLYLAFMAAGLTVSGLLAERLQLATRPALLLGTACAAAAIGGIALSVHLGTSLWAIRGALALLGVGFGQLIGRLIMVVQNTAPAHQIGVATTGIRFFQSLGTAVGAAVLGSVLSRVYEARSGSAMSSHPASMSDFTVGIEVVFLAAGAVILLAMFFATQVREPAMPIREPEPIAV